MIVRRHAIQYGHEISRTYEIICTGLVCVCVSVCVFDS